MHETDVVLTVVVCVHSVYELPSLVKITVSYEVYSPELRDVTSFESVGSGGF